MTQASLTTSRFVRWSWLGGALLILATTALHYLQSPDDPLRHEVFRRLYSARASAPDALWP